MKNNYLDSRTPAERAEEPKGITTRTEEWEKDFESLWEASFDREGDKNTFEYKRLEDFIFDQISLAEERGAKKERERIAKKIEKMPHEEYCGAGIRALGKPCNCWKKKVLSFLKKKYCVRLLGPNRQLFVKKIKEIFDEEINRVINIAVDETIEQAFHGDITMEKLIKIIKKKI